MSHIVVTFYATGEAYDRLIADGALSTAFMAAVRNAGESTEVAFGRLGLRIDTTGEGFTKIAGTMPGPVREAFERALSRLAQYDAQQTKGQKLWERVRQSITDYQNPAVYTKESVIGYQGGQVTVQRFLDGLGRNSDCGVRRQYPKSKRKPRGCPG
jgi:hypothetical protein